MPRWVTRIFSADAQGEAGWQGYSLRMPNRRPIKLQKKKRLPNWVGGQWRKRHAGRQEYSLLLLNTRQDGRDI
jgi:hypothetical protein